MKKNLYSLFALFLIIGNGDICAYQQDFGLTSVTLRRNLLGASYSRQYDDSVFSLPIPGNDMRKFFNENRQHFNPGSSPITGTFGADSAHLLNAAEWEMIFADNDIDRKTQVAVDAIQGQLQYLREKLTEYGNWMSGFNTGEDAYEKNNKYLNKLKEELDRLSIHIKDSLNLNSLRAKLSEKEDANVAIKCIDDIKSMNLLIANVLESKFSELGDKVPTWKKTFSDVFIDLEGSINKLREYLPEFIEKHQEIGGKELMNIYDYVNSVYLANVNAQPNRVVYQQNDPRLSYILNWGSDNKFKTDIIMMEQGGIFKQLRDRTSRNEFREKSGFSWKDMLDLMTHELFVARNKGNLLVQHFLTEVIQDIYDTPEAWVPIEGPNKEQEIQCVNDTSKRLAFLMAEGKVNKVNPQFVNRNNATTTLEQYVNAINRVKEISLKDVDHAANAANYMISLFNLNPDQLTDKTIDELLYVSKYDQTQEASKKEDDSKTKRSQTLKEVAALYSDKSFIDSKYFSAYDCGYTQTKGDKNPDWTCCLNSSLRDYCNNDWFDGIFYFNGLANSGELKEYFDDLEKAASAGKDRAKEAVSPKKDGEKEAGGVENDQSKFYRKIVELGASREPLATDQVFNLLGTFLGVDKLVYNYNNKLINFARNTVFGPTLAISGDGEHHFQGLRLYKDLDKAKDQTYSKADVKAFTKPTYVEMLEAGANDLKKFFEEHPVKSDDDEEESEEEVAEVTDRDPEKDRELVQDHLGTLSAVAQFAYNVAAWRDPWNFAMTRSRNFMPIPVAAGGPSGS